MRRHKFLRDMTLNPEFFFNTTFGICILIEGKSWRKGRDIRERTEQVAEIVGRGLGVHCLENMEGSLSQKEAHSLWRLGE